MTKQKRVRAVTLMHHLCMKTRHWTTRTWMIHLYTKIPRMSQQESAWYVPPAAEQSSGWPMWGIGMGGQAYWPGKQPHVEEQAHEQAHEQVDPTQSRRPRARGRNTIEPKLVGPIPGGPEIPDLLLSFTAHTAYFIYQIIERPTLTFQLKQEQLRKWKLDDEYAWCDHVRNIGLTHLQDLMYIYVDQPLISTFLERWQPETNSFHMPFGEMTITLLDVYMILGLHIDGQGMGVVHTSYMGPPALQGYECSSDYMEWYIPRTHPYVRPEDAGIRDPVQVIGQALHRLNPFYNAEKEQFYNMHTAVRECIQDFRPYEYDNVEEEDDED